MSPDPEVIGTCTLSTCTYTTYYARKNATPYDEFLRNGVEVCSIGQLCA